MFPQTHLGYYTFEVMAYEYSDLGNQVGVQGFKLQFSKWQID